MSEIIRDSKLQNCEFLLNFVQVMGSLFSGSKPSVSVDLTFNKRPLELHLLEHFDRLQEKSPVLDNMLKTCPSLDPSEFKEKFQCSICFEPLGMHSLKQTKCCRECFQAYCHTCYEQLKEKRCPNCKGSRMKDATVINKYLFKEYTNTNYQCKQCKEVFRGEAILKHREDPRECKKALLLCKCQEKIIYKNAD